ncbi:MAG: von Willebrand factor type A domain-containing protein [Candidatus Sulfomarinibacteraceae bacterium]
MTMNNIERMLTDQPVPPSPVGLVEDIKDQVPDNIEIHPALLEHEKVAPWHRRRWLRAAVAAIFVVALTAAVSWRMRSTGPWMSGLSNPDDQVLRNDGHPESRVQVDPLPARIEDRRQDSDATVQPEPELQVALDEMVTQKFKGETTVTGSLIPRADLTALSPVTVMEVPGKPSTGGTREPNDQPYGDVFFKEYGVNPFIDTEDDRYSTFSLEVDTASYNIVKRYLEHGDLPPREAVRTEEIINAFDYGDEPPARGDFGLTAEGAPSPFGEGQRYKIVRFGVNARTVANIERPAAVLTFVVDVSGSMDRENRLGLVKQALDELLDNLREDDRVGLVIYGSRGDVLLEPSLDHDEIRAAINRLTPGGSTNAEEGLVLAYQLADRYREDGLINRVILCSDGVANVGNTGPDSILERIKVWADNGIELTTVGFGMGNYNDVLMEQLADNGDGRYAYVDTLAEVNKLFVEELVGTLFTIGSETKAQVEFNPEVVSRYRLIGYENRDIADEDFRNDAVDAGEIGAGHTATAVYEIKLHRDLRRQSREEVATLRVRYLPFGAERVKEIKHRLQLRDMDGRWEKAQPSLKLATLVAEYAEILKQSYWARSGDMDEVLSRARELAPEFADDERVAEWIELVQKAAELIRDADEDALEITD